MMECVPAIFIDRDGTINVDHGYVYEINRFQFIDGVINACHTLKRMGFKQVLITNQSGIARGKFSEKQFIFLTKWMNWFLAHYGVEFDRIYYCPHHPEAIIKKYCQVCYCRKPQPGMLLHALHELNIDISSSYIVGDKLEDIQAGRAVGIGTTVLVRSGQSLTEKGKELAHWVLNSFADLPDAIKKRIYIDELNKS